MRYAALMLALALCLPGCGGSRPVAEKPAPLTVAEWKALPAAQKYEVETLERLKDTDPTFAAPGKWEAFVRTTVIPGRKKELPAGK